MQPTQNLSGQVIKSYEVKERIGAGGFGAVYLGVQANIDRDVAIKVILPEHANHPEFIKRFDTEAQLVARLEHPHIVPLYDYWREPNSAYLVMRYLRGGSLRDSIDEHGAWDATRVSMMISQIAAALTFAHRNGVIHRDLKSDNILLDENDNYYLTDFGIAKDLGADQDLTQDAIMGTPAYLSPEQIRGEIASPQSDVYALGILAYEALTGSKPFVDNSPATVLFKQLNDPLPAVTVTRPDLPEAIDDVLQRATAKDAPDRYETALIFARELQNAVREVSPGMATLPSGNAADMMSITQAEQDIFEPKNPYKGLRAFQQADAGEFFGRQGLVADLVHQLAIDGNNQDFLAVVGPSGSGKSSVIKAGLIPKIQNGALDDERDWYTVDMVPGTHPLEELEAGLLSIAPREIPGLLQLLGEDNRGLVRAIKRILPREEAEVVLFIDQFEEVFTLVEDEDERSHFLDTILEAATDSRSRLKIIITIRADFYDRPLLYSKFGELIRENTELVLPLNEEELRAAIAEPAEKVGLSLDAGLPDAIISDVNEQPGALPLMQYALTELFERREKRRLTLDAYRDIGGTAGALAQRAEELFQSFDDETQAATHQMFLRLVTLGEGTEDTRRRVMRSELLSVAKFRDEMEHAIQMFGKYRLLTFDHDPQTRSSTVEVAHEALIRQWDRVREWLAENREALRMHRRLTTATDEWQQANQDPSYLARGNRLQQWEEWAENTDIAMTDAERAYLQASIQAREERLAAERAQQEREDRLRRRARNLLGVVAAVATIAAIVSIGLFLDAANSRSDAVQEAAQAATARAEAEESETESRSLALAANARNALAANDPLLALPLAIEAESLYSPAPTEVLRTLMSATYAEGPRYRYTNHSGSVLDVTFARNSEFSASASVDGTIRVWDNRTGEESVMVEVPGVRFNGVAVHPQATSFAGAASNGTIYLWDFETGEQIRTFDGHEGEVLSIAYSPDGLFLGSGGEDATVRIWNITDGNQRLLIDGHTGTVYQVVFSPDGSRIASSSGDATLLDTRADDVDRTVRIWDTETGDQVQLIDPQSGFVRALDYGPDGETIAYGVWDGTNAGTVRIHDADTGEEIRRFFAHTTPLTAVVYSPDGREIVSTAWDRTVRIWDVERGTEIQSFTGFSERILGLDYSQNDQFLLLGIGNIGDNEFVDDLASDTSVWLWDISSRDQIGVYDDHQDWVWTVDITSDGSIAASAGGPLNLPETDDDLTVERLGNAIRIWDVETGDTLQEMRGHTNTVDSVKFIADDAQILSASWDGNIIRWDANTGERLGIYRAHENQVRMLAVFDDESRGFLSAGNDGTIRQWDIESEEDEIISAVTTEVTTTGDDGNEITSTAPVPIWSIDINPEQTQVAGAYNDGSIRIWELESGELAQELCCHDSNVQEARFHPNGQWLVSSSWDNTIRLWDLETGTELRQFAGHNGHTFGIDFSSNGELMLTTSEDTTVRMWEVASGEEIHRFDSHTNWIQEVIFSPDDTFALSAGQDNTARIWRIDRNTDDLVRYARDIRYIRDLTCAERDLYRLEPCPAS